MDERIICAAIWYKEQNTAMINPINVTSGVVICGHRHPHCIYTFKALTGKRSVTPECGDYIQGFLTNKNRFVDRYEAKKIAIEQNQIINNNIDINSGLFSEDIY